MKYIKILIISLITFNAHAQVYDAVIAADGTGDYPTLQRALDRLRSGTNGRFLFYVKAGYYKEKLAIARDNVSLIGEGKEKVIIDWDDYSGDPEGHSTSSSYTVEVSGNSFYAENITFKNSAGKVGQAVAVSVTGSELIFKNCDFIGFQDTYYAKKGKQYHVDCHIEGGTDFIFGEATCVFENCEIECVSGGQYITAPADTKLITQVNGQNFYHGLLFNNCNIIPGTGVSNNTYYLARPWQPNSSTVYTNCTFGNHIQPLGWSTWDNNNHLSGFYGEYNSRDLSGNLVDVSARVDWSHQISKEVADTYYALDYFLQGWDPLPMTVALAAPSNLVRNINKTDAFDFSWDEVSDALGYVIYKNDALYGFSKSNNFIDSISSVDDQYVLKSVSGHGALSEASEVLQGADVNQSPLELSTEIFFRGLRFESQKPVRLEVYDLSGKKLFYGTDIQKVDLNPYVKGVVLIRGVDNTGKSFSYKVAR